MGPLTNEDDRSLWLQAYREHGPSILAFLTSRTGRRERAEELLQETFVRAMRRGPEVASAEHLRSYLFTTAHHLVISDRRRNRIRLFSELTEAEAPGIAEAPGGAAESPARLPSTWKESARGWTPPWAGSARPTGRLSKPPCWIRSLTR